MRGALYVESSKNTKIGDADATYTSIKSTCPDSCALKHTACYAETGYVGIINARMNRRARGDSPLAVARAEAKAIDLSYNGGPVPGQRDLRIHVSGDSRTWAGTRAINNAVGRWKIRGGGEAWSYTHAHAHVPRELWSNVSVLASVDSVKEVAAARANGYAPAIVVNEHSSEKAYLLDGSDVKWIPCPSQTRGVSCVDCRLCFNADRLYEKNMGIAFAVHGVRKEQFKRRYLTVIT